MQINGIKTFKIDEVDPTGGTDGTGGTITDPTADTVESDLNDIFGDTTTDETPSTSGDGWIIDDPTAPADGAEAMTLDKLADYPPDLDYILAQNESAIRYLNIIKQRYETTKEGLVTLRDNYTAALSSVTSSEASILQRKIELVNAAIAKCDQQIEKCNGMMDEGSRIYVQEGQVCKDLNGDGWIMRPGGDNSVRVVYDEDKKAYYMDKDGNRIENPFTDPDYVANIINGDAMTQIDAADGIGTDSEDAIQTDFYFKLNELQQTYSGENNKFGTPINIGVPEYIWVPRDGKSWDPLIDDDAADLKYKVDPSLWSNGVQNAPEDKNGFVQVRVAEVCVESDEVMTTTDGDKLSNTVISFKDAEGTTIVSFRIEGYFGSGPASAMTGEGDYVAASSVGISFYNSNRSSPVIFDASKYESTGRHILDSFASTMGISDSEELSYQENEAAFEGESFTTQYSNITGSGTGSVGNWTPVEHNYDYANYHDRYMPEQPGATDSLERFTTGVFVTGLRGSFTGSKNNDIFDIPDVDFTTDYIDEHRPDDADPIRKGDAFYSTVIDGKGGNDVVKAGKGDLYARRVSFAWVDAGRDDSVLISVPTATYTSRGEGSEGIDADDTINADPKNFVRVHGAGETGLYDEGEKRDSKNVGGFDDGYDHDDYYELSGDIVVSNPADMDIVGSGEMGDGSQAGQFGAEWIRVKDEYQTPLENAINGIGEEEVNPFDAPTVWNNEYGYAAEQDSLMDDFFNEMFGDMNEFSVEMEEME